MTDKNEAWKAPVLNSKAQEYSGDNARYFAYVSLWAYAGKEEAKAPNPGFNFTARQNEFFAILQADNSQKFISGGGDTDAVDSSDPAFWQSSTQVRVLFQGGDVIVAFRGSEARLDDWLVNLAVPHRDGGGGAVHAGFWMALDAVWRELLNAIGEPSPKARLWITGHSLGGALAVLMAARLKYGDGPNTESAPDEPRAREWAARMAGIYTFGQPRVGDWYFASNFEDAYGDRCFRFVNNDDVVARVPPPPMGFAHVGRRLYFDRRGVLCERDRGADLVADHYWQTLEKARKSSHGAVADHSLLEYIIHLEKNVDFEPDVRSNASARQVLWSEWKKLGFAHEKPGGANGAHDFKTLPIQYGLALSGGGIRSATFSLGLLQALASCGLLGRMHYLSTVSGGGYTGAWLSAWIHRTATALRPEGQTASPEDAEAVLQSVESRLGGRQRDAGGLFNDASEAREITWLRRFSNYLTPNAALLSADTLAAVSTWLRNTLLNQLLLCSVFLCAMFVLWLLVGWFPLGADDEAAGHSDAWLWGWGLVFGVCLWLAWSQTRPGKVGRSGSLEISRALTAAFGLLWLCLPFVAFGSPVLKEILPFVSVTNSTSFVSFAPPVTLLGAFVLGSVVIGLTNRVFTEISLEWWARVNGYLLYLAVVWLVFAGITFWTPLLIARAWGALLAAGGVTWLVTTAVGVWSAKGRSTGRAGERGVSASLAAIVPYVFVLGLLGGLAEGTYTYTTFVLSKHEQGRFCSYLPIDAACEQNAPSVDSGCTSIILSFEDYGCQSARRAKQLVAAVLPSWSLPVWGVTLVGLSAVFMLLSVLININRFSLHFLYRNRLERCYLGASNTTRHPNRFTGLSSDDSLDLACLANMRPYPLINAALNITHQPDSSANDQLGWQERKAASFLFSPLYCGYRLAYGERGVDAFQQTNCIARTTPVCDRSASAPRKDRQSITVGMAMTISGAAASPNSGYHTRPATAFLLTLFNARLGWWLQNPRRERSWRAGTSWFSAGLLFMELAGLSNDKRDYIYLSDGGHFENLGIYELVRRRCAVIIVSDASCDEKFEFEDLGNAVRKCRTDFGADIQLDPRALIPGPDGLSQFHCAVGVIRYPETEELPAMRGQILYIKPSLSGDEATDILQYGKAHSGFPHQSTADQWFDESQFESYRKLGHHIGEKVVGDIYRQQADKEDVIGLLDRLWRRWHRPHSYVDSAMSRHGERLEALFDELRTSPPLAVLHGQLFTDWTHLTGAVPPAAAPLGSDVLLFSARLFQLMEDIFVDLHLLEDVEHPDLQGWINLFKQWSGAPLLRTAWSLFSCTYGQRFRDFCEEVVQLPAGRALAGSLVVGANPITLSGACPTWLTGRGAAYFNQHLLAYTAALPGWTFDLIEFTVVTNIGVASVSYPLGYCVVACNKAATPIIADLSLRPHLRGLGLARPVVLELRGLKPIGYARLEYLSMMAGEQAQSLYDVLHAEGIYPRQVS